MAPEETRQQRLEPAHKPGPLGPFYLQELINCGGMSEIWLATDEDQKAYALRLLRKTSRFNFTDRGRFVNGCQVLSKIHNHEFVIGYVKHGKIRGLPYLLMEYVEGANLKQLLATGDPVLHQYVGNIIIDMAGALEHVHESGFMHLDFKPENVLVSRNGNVRLVDFDLSQPIPKKPTKLSRNPGTPAYMAPEQLLRQPIDQRVDLFAFGVSAYELLTGLKPFAGETAADVLRLELDRTDFIPPRGHNPEIPPGLEQAILKCLEREPDKRYAIAGLLVRDLENILYID
jgi:eukaryotic-like serine/threonine-protein kinase